MNIFLSVQYVWRSLFLNHFPMASFSAAYATNQLVLLQKLRNAFHCWGRQTYLFCNIVNRYPIIYCIIYAIYSIIYCINAMSHKPDKIKYFSLIFS